MSDPSTRQVAVVGGGVAGLAAAHELVQRAPHLQVTVLEGASDIGGKLRTTEVAGVQVDVGAEAMLFRRPEGVALARAVGLGEDLVHPASTTSNLWNRGALVPMPRTLMGVPTDLRGLDQVLSAKGIARAAMDAVLPATELGEADRSVGDLVEERLGREVVDRLIEPLLGGVYAGHAREISARAAVPQIVALLSRDRSMVKAAAASLPAPAAGPAPGSAAASPAPAPVFAGIRGGVGRLPQAVAGAAEAWGVQIRTDAVVRDLARRPGGGWNVVVGSTRDPEVLQFDAVVLATPASPTARLLSDVAPAAALALARIEYASMSIVTLAFRADDLPDLPGSGFLVPPVDGHVVKAATFSFAKWGWVREAGRGAGASGEDLLVLRCSIGRHRQEHLLQVPDEELVTTALVELGQAAGIAAVPVDTHVQRWGGALPQYAVGHLDRVAAVRAELAGIAGLEVCGAAYDGLGIPACISSAHRAVDGLLADLS